MIKRIISGVALVGIIIGFLFLRRIETMLFNVVLFGVSSIGSYEYIKMAKTLTKAKKGVILALGILLVPIFTLFQILFQNGLTYGLILIGVAVLAIICLLIFEFEDSIENTGIALLGIVYPSVFVLFMLALNTLNVKTETGLICLPICLPFVIAPLTDTLAYFVGALLGKRKMCPKISPKKTIAGGVGGIIGGTLGGILVYFIVKPQLPINLDWLFFMIMGLIGGAITEFGDLIESVLKRKFGVKDSGNLIPGHGGMLDRMDSILFLSWFVYLVFMLVL